MASSIGSGTTEAPVDGPPNRAELVRPRASTTAEIGAPARRNLFIECQHNETCSSLLAVDLETLDALRSLKYRYLRTLDLKQWDEFAATLTQDVQASYGTRLSFDG